VPNRSRARSADTSNVGVDAARDGSFSAATVGGIAGTEMSSGAP
jgi:hypothetical protein